MSDKEQRISYEYLLTDGQRGEVGFDVDAAFREFLKTHKKTIDTMTVTLDDGRRFIYERTRGWEEFDTPF